MRILFLAESLPGPDVDGYVIRNRGLLGRFVELGEVDVLSYAKGATPAPLGERLRSETVYEVPPYRLPSLATRAREILSADGIYHYYDEFAELLRQRCAEVSYDVIWLGGWKMIQYAPVARSCAPVARIVADAADDEIRGHEIEREKLTSRRERLYFTRQIIRRKRLERRTLPLTDAVLFVSEVDAACSRARHPDLRIEVRQNGVDTDAFAPAEAPVDDPVLAFEGTMDFGPNVEGALHFGRDIWPRVLRDRPEARALIVGRNPVPEVVALGSDRLEVTGTVEDVRDAVLRASVFVSPLRGGIGQKNKILQAWSMGIPIVATPISVAGLEARGGENVVLAETPEAFAAACVDLMGDRDKRRRIGDAGRATALRAYSIPAKMDEVEDLLHDLLGRSVSPRASRPGAGARRTLTDRAHPQDLVR